MLFTVLTCNRMYYAKNCIESILEFVDMDRIKLLICDNCTVEKGFESYLNEVANRHKNVVVKRFRDRVRNELYRAMNYAILHAKKRKMDIVNFIQDDYQYLYKNDKHLDDTISILERYPKIVQVNHNMAWWRKRKKEGKSVKISVGDTNYLNLVRKKACDSGFTRVAAYEKLGLYPGHAISWEGGDMYNLKKKRYDGKLNGEMWFGSQCRKREWTRCISCHPSQTMIFDCAYVRGNKRFGKYFPPPKKFYIKPFGEKEIAEVKRNNDAFCLSYIEKMSQADGWKPETFEKHSTNRKVVRIKK